MPKKPVKLIPLRCPFCDALFDKGRPNERAEGDDVLTFTYGCGAHVGMYKYPGGWRMDIFECKKKLETANDRAAQPKLKLFDEA